MKVFVVLLTVALARADPFYYTSPIVSSVYKPYDFVPKVVSPVEYKAVEYKDYKYVKPELKEYKPVEYKEYKPVEYKPVEYKEYKPVEYKFVKPEMKAIKPVEYKYEPKIFPYTYGYGMPVMAASPIVPKYHAKSAEGVEHIVHKREAEADAFHPYFYGANQWAYKAPVAYTAPVAYAKPVVYHQPIYAPYKVKAFKDDRIDSAYKGYAAKNSYVAENAGAIHIAKRDASAPFMAHPYTYSYGYPYTYSHVAPAVHHSPVMYKPYMYSQVKTLKDARLDHPEVDYAGKGSYKAVSAGAVHLAKRDADADAQGYGYPYTTYGYNAGYASPYVSAYNNGYYKPYSYYY